MFLVQKVNDEGRIVFYDRSLIDREAASGYSAAWTDVKGEARRFESKAYALQVVKFYGGHVEEVAR